MSRTWNKDTIKKVTIKLKTVRYRTVLKSAEEIFLEETNPCMLKSHPDLFNFEAISIEHKDIGKLCLVPLDDSSKGNAEYILRAIKAYKGE